MISFLTVLLDTVTNYGLSFQCPNNVMKPFFKNQFKYSTQISINVWLWLSSFIDLLNFFKYPLYLINFKLISCFPRNRILYRKVLISFYFSMIPSEYHGISPKFLFFLKLFSMILQKLKILCQSTEIFGSQNQSLGIVKSNFCNFTVPFHVSVYICI